MCFCKPCQKTAGPNGSVNIIVPNDAVRFLRGPMRKYRTDMQFKQFKALSGKTEVWSRNGESGKGVHCNFCVTCHTYVTVNIDSMEGLTVVKSGTIDGDALGAPPAAEIYTRNRPAWCESKEGRAEFTGAFA